MDDEYDEEDDEYDEEDDDDVDMIDTMLMMLEELSTEEIRMMPDVLLDQILDNADFFPEKIVRKVRKARGK